ncbi:hypothetical protein Syun_011670 [Stephania yunnanensis]|uniref:Uncharacterized protein n=1 Tax=Stephania yunnanensis TaxID=152371 RepID=A0AAP0PIB7_9MAGN
MTCGMTIVGPSSNNGKEPVIDDYLCYGPNFITPVIINYFQTWTTAQIHVDAGDKVRACLTK